MSFPTINLKSIFIRFFMKSACDLVFVASLLALWLDFP